MTPLTNPTAISVIATAGVLTACLIVISIKSEIDLRKFRANIKPGDYAKVEPDSDGNLIRCKLLQIDGPFYLFQTVHTRERFQCIKSKIYQP